jgi:hypothetical protein
MVARTRLGSGLRVIFSRASGEIESDLVADGKDARDVALIIIGRYDELEEGDRLTVTKE